MLNGYPASASIPTHWTRILSKRMISYSMYLTEGLCIQSSAYTMPAGPDPSARVANKLFVFLVILFFMIPSLYISGWSSQLYVLSRFELHASIILAICLACSGSFSLRPRHDACILFKMIDAVDVSETRPGPAIIRPTCNLALSSTRKSQPRK